MLTSDFSKNSLVHRRSDFVKYSKNKRHEIRSNEIRSEHGRTTPARNVPRSPKWAYFLAEEGRMKRLSATRSANTTNEKAIPIIYKAWTVLIGRHRSVRVVTRWLDESRDSFHYSNRPEANQKSGEIMPCRSNETYSFECHRVKSRWFLFVFLFFSLLRAGQLCRIWPGCSMNYKSRKRVLAPANGELFKGEKTSRTNSLTLLCDFFSLSFVRGI